MGAAQKARWATVAGLVAAALGLVVLRFAGLPMPPVPPALVLMVGAVVLLVAVDRRWVPAVAVLVAAAEMVGFVLSGGVADLVGAESVGLLIGSWLRGAGTAVALVAGIVAVAVPRPPRVRA